MSCSWGVPMVAAGEMGEMLGDDKGRGAITCCCWCSNRAGPPLTKLAAMEDSDEEEEDADSTGAARGTDLEEEE